MSAEEYLAIEEERDKVMITSLRNIGNGYTGHTVGVTKQKLINKLIVAGIVEDGETVYFEEMER